MRAHVGDDIEVTSAGLLTEGEPPDISAVAALAELGYEVPRFQRSRRLTREVLAHADLVIGLARQHVRDAVVLDRDVFQRAFTLRELVRRAESNPPLGDSTSFDEWLARLHEGREVASLLIDDPTDDIIDPRGRPPDAYRATARDIDELVRRVAAMFVADGAGDAVRTGPEIEAWHGPTTSAERTALIGLVTDGPTAPLTDELRDALAARGAVPVAPPAPPQPDWVACGAVAAHAITSGILDLVVCTSTNAAGTAAAANRHRGVRAVATADTRSAVAAREQLGANVLCVDAAFASATVARAIVTVFLGAADDPDSASLERLDGLPGMGEPPADR